eukprot:CAMPEP_0197189810 /NCGR_PEP_ID=MMETSP1423-20130617/20424_1 /TAXON_ID=476441 /ORGANISM="Pseudo-nitzschia heimii, Strain UNC1101" /LENGTH=260 /DNA_ID=CAMNT_0042642027 /DNA_START=54 /DNA_END=836 /DNA_ORIENTATION=+
MSKDTIADTRPPKSTSKKKNPVKPKRWTWSKPKDKPKRPLSAYNIFFKHTRSRIVQGLSEVEATEEEVVASIKTILGTAHVKKKRDRRSHGKISFGNLASTVSNKWKNTSDIRVALFQRYADQDKKRYYDEVAVWKAKKDAEVLLLLANQAPDFKPKPMVGRDQCSPQVGSREIFPQPVRSLETTPQSVRSREIIPQPVRSRETIPQPVRSHEPGSPPNLSREASTHTSASHTTTATDDNDNECVYSTSNIEVLSEYIII